MSYSVKVTVNSATKVNNSGSFIENLELPKLIYSTSAVMKTEGSGQNATSVTVSCTKNIEQDNTEATSCSIGYLKDQSTPPKKFKNSLVIGLNYKNNNGSVIATQEVIVLAGPGIIYSVVWKNNRTIEFNENSSDITYTGEITVDIKYLTTSGNTHNTIKQLTLFNFYVSAHGHKTSGQLPTDDTKLGSYNSMSRAFHRRWSNNWTENQPRDLNEVVPNMYGSSGYTIDGTWYKYQLNPNIHPRTFSFIPPILNGQIDKPNYYIIIAFKSYASGIGHIQVLDKDASIFKDESNYWDSGWRYGGLRYTVFAIYSDGVSPNFKDEYKRGNLGSNSQYRDTAYEYAQYVYFDYPPRLINISWYGTTDGRTFNILHDGTKTQDLIYAIVYSTNAVQIDIPTTDIDYSSEEYQVEGYYVGSSGTNWDTSTLKQGSYFNSIIPNKDLFFAVKLKLKQHNVKYKDKNTGNLKTDIENHGKELIIDPFGNLPSGYATHKNPNTGQSNDYYNRNGYSITVIKDIALEEPSASINYRFVGWERTGNKISAVWEPNTITITYNPNGGGGNPYIVSDVPYNQNYQIRTITQVNFTPPSGKKFIRWDSEPDGTGTPYIPGTYRKFTTNTTLYAIWGSPWRKVKWIWVYEPDRADGPNDDHGWKRHKVWVNIK